MRDINSPYGPAGNRSIRNIPVPASHRRHMEVEEDEEPRPRRRKKGGRWFWVSALLVVVLAAFGALLVSTVFAGATVTVFPRIEEVQVPARAAAALNASGGTLPYANMAVTRSATTTVKATGSQHVERQASGRIIIYNNFSSASQRLIANTRFQATDGKIYRVKDSVDVPGNGSAQATIYADSPGPSYNKTETTRFTIPGFKGDPRYDKFYAESLGSISGGFVGNEPAVAEADLKKAQTAMEQALEAALREAAVADLPEGYILIPGTLVISFSDVLKGETSGDTVTITQDSEAQGQILKQTDLASFIARQTLNDYGGEPVDFRDVKEVSVSLATTTKASGTIELALRGNTILVWQFDPEGVKSSLLGKPKGEFESIIESFEPAISRAEARIRPFWQTAFPSDPAKIRVIVGNR